MKLRNILPVTLIAVLVLPAIVAHAASPSITVSASPGTINSVHSTTISYTLSNIIPANVMVMINDSGGNIVWSTYLHGQHAGPGTVAWNGRDSGGNPVPDGHYSVKFTADNGSFGTHGPGAGQLDYPFSLTVDGAGNIYVADKNNHRIQVFDNNGAQIRQIGTLGAGNGQFFFPNDVAVDSAGNIYVADTLNYRIQVFDKNGAYITQFGSEGGDNGQFKSPSGVTLDSAGNIYVADTDNNRIQVFSNSGTYMKQFGGLGWTDGKLSGPVGVAVDSAGNTYVADTNSNRIQVFDNNGNFLRKFGAAGAGDGQFSVPYSVAVDSTGNTYVADTGNHRIQVFDNNGIYMKQFGTQGSGDGQLDHPYGVALDSAGNIYVGDTHNDRIQVFYFGAEGTTSVSVDNTAPTVQFNVAAPNSNGWYNGDVPFTLNAADNAGGSGIDTIKYSFDNVIWNTGTSSTGTAEGTNTVYWDCTDKAGNSATGSQTIKIDKGKPIITGAATTTANSNGWYNHNVAVHFQATDATSGVYHVDPDVLLTADGNGQTATGTAEDMAGNTNPTTVTGINIDKTAPVVTGAATTTPNHDGWYNHSVQVNFTATDALSGIAGIDPNATLSGDGAGQAASCTATDKAGNSATATVSGLNIDTVAPATVGTLTGATVTLAATDAVSGVAYTEYRIDSGNWARYTVPVTLSSSCAVYYRSADLAGNLETTGSLAYTKPNSGAPLTISMDEMYGRLKTILAPTATPIPAVNPTPPGVATPTVTPTPAVSPAPTENVTPSPAATAGQSQEGSGYLLWLIIAAIGVVALAAGGYLLFFRK